ncbi:hypothetical protein N7471_005803, partial [Penicillium samsonianum]|uniref:uncharacterized protein n=1 Tax=Penicillium samsonianum TaxID=1882272 RepID=UPI0025473075
VSNDLDLAEAATRHTRKIITYQIHAKFGLMLFHVVLLLAKGENGGKGVLTVCLGSQTKVPLFFLIYHQRAPIRSRRTLRPRWSRGITKRNAAERVFNIPELVSEIVHWQVQGLDEFVYEKSRGIGVKKQWVRPTKFRRWTMGLGTKREPYVEDQAGYLWPFASLNRAWYTEIIHRQQTWKNTMGAMDTPAVPRSLDLIFAKVPAQFRQQYADHVELASLVTVNAGDARAADAALRDVRFPKLRVLKLCVRGSSRDSDIRTLMDGVHIPRIQGESVTVLSISSYGGREPEWRWPLHGLPEDWAKLFRRISVLFPNLEKVEIGHQVLVGDKVVKSFARRHPALRTLERRLLERSILAFDLH